MFIRILRGQVYDSAATLAEVARWGRELGTGGTQPPSGLLRFAEQLLEVRLLAEQPLDGQPAVEARGRELDREVRVRCGVHAAHQPPGGEDGEPLSLREKIRASGLTFDAIAAEALRYA